MTTLSDTIFLCAPTFRSRAYAQAMAAETIMPDKIILLPGKEPTSDIQQMLSLSIEKHKNITFNPSIPARSIFSNTDLIKAPTADVNSEQFINFLSEFNHTVVIYSGIGGTILRQPLLSIGKKFLHVHGGYAPNYRGSTAFYYSLLKEGTLAATALWLECEIDAGPILGRKKYLAIDGIDIDTILDPCVRASLLLDIMKIRKKTGSYPKGFKDNRNAFTYFVIHPLLKYRVLKQHKLLRP